MTSFDDQPLSLIEAARLIYQTQQPTPDQVYRVLVRLKGGVLKGTRAGKTGWTTTAEYVAEYLARKSVYQRASRPDAPKTCGRGREPDNVTATFSREHTRTLRSAYGEMLKDYFLAIFLRRKRKHRSMLFQRCVIATQVALVAFIFWLAAAAVKLGMAPIPTERQVVEQWIKENAGERFQIVEWHPVERSAEGLIVPVDYKYYRNGAKPVETYRRFLVTGDQVKLLENE